MSHSSVNVSKSAAPGAKQVYRLTDMEVEEVSLVDRAANNKRFMVVKQEDGMSVNAKEIMPNGKGGFTTTQAKGGATGADGKGKKPMGKAALEVPPGFKEAAGPLLDKAVAKIEELAASLKGAKPAEISDEGDLPGVPADFANGLAGVCALLEKIGTMWPAAPAEPTEEEPGENTDGGDAPPEPTEMQLRATEKAIVNSAALLKRADVKKIGAKMSKDRYTRLQQAAQVLTNLIGELAPAPAAPEVPALGKAKDKAEEKDKAKGGDVKKMIDEAIAPIGKAIEGLAGHMNTLAGALKAQQGDITAIKKSRVAPNAIIADGSYRDSEPENVSWPLDMNNQVNREKVGKADYFGPDED